MPGIDIAICTFNRLGYLQSCVSTILPQLLGDHIGLMIVDNNSTDGTAAWASALADDHPGVTYIHVKEQGISHARNGAWKASKRKWILYLDDECRVSEGWIKYVWNLVVEDPDLDAIGSAYVAQTHGEVMSEAELEAFSYALPYTTRTLLQDRYVHGSPLMIRTQVLQALGGFDIRLGMRGYRMGYSEEIELQDRMRKNGYTIAYDPGLWVYHLVRPEKRSIGWTLRSEYMRRRYMRAYDPLPVRKASVALAATMAGRLYWIPVFGVRCLTKKDFSGRHFILAVCGPVMYRLGDLIGSIMTYSTKK